MINEDDTVALVCDLKDFGLSAGDPGTVGHVYAKGRAYEVEFMTLTGDTIGVVTLEADVVRPVTERVIADSRQVA